MKTVDFVALVVEKSAQYTEDVIGTVSDIRSGELRRALSRVIALYVEHCTNEKISHLTMCADLENEVERRAAAKAATKAGVH